MVIVFSENLSPKTKELIVNTIFEVQEGMPNLANFYSPLLPILSQSKGEGLVHSKCTGDEIFDSKMLEKAKKVYYGIKNEIKTPLISVLLGKINDSDCINIVDSVPVDDLNKLLSYGKVYSIGEIDSKDIVPIKLTSLDEYLSLKSELNDFFDEISKQKDLKPNEEIRQITFNEVCKDKAKSIKDLLSQKISELKNDVRKLDEIEYISIPSSEINSAINDPSEDEQLIGEDIGFTDTFLD